jgi:hypothetical protein
MVREWCCGARVPPLPSRRARRAPRARRAWLEHRGAVVKHVDRVAAVVESQVALASSASQLSSSLTSRTFNRDISTSATLGDDRRPRPSAAEAWTSALRSGGGSWRRVARCAATAASTAGAADR